MLKMENYLRFYKCYMSVNVKCLFLYCELKFMSLFNKIYQKLDL